MAGQITTFVFDKTGTLTEEGLSVLGFRPTQSSEVIERRNSSSSPIFIDFCKDVNEISSQNVAWWNDPDTKERRRNLNTTLLVECMASCTAITYVNGELVGDPLDVKMFEATGW